MTSIKREDNTVQYNTRLNYSVGILCAMGVLWTSVGHSTAGVGAALWKSCTIAHCLVWMQKAA